MSRAHSLISASSFKRTRMCPASYRAGQQLGSGGNRSSSFAVEGTVAHYISETALEGKKELANHLGETITIDGHSITVDEEMVDMADMYVGFVETLRSLGYLVWLEQRVSPNWLWSPALPPVDLFGTADCIAFHPDLAHLVVVDLKYGRGIPVEVEWNDQTLYYILGAIPAVGELLQTTRVLEERGPTGLTSVEAVIIQPRAPHRDGPIRRKTYTVNEVLKWGTDTLVPAVDQAVHDANAPFAAGDHCKFCPAAARCPEILKTAQDKARSAFTDDPADHDGAEWKKLLDTADVLETWIGAVRKAAHERIENGLPVDDWKLVPKRATRKWRNDDAVVELLEIYNVDKKLWLDTDIRSPAQILAQKVVKSDPELHRALLDQVTSISTGTTLAPADDPRPAVPARGSARDAFSNDALDTEDNG